MFALKVSRIPGETRGSLLRIGLYGLITTKKPMSLDTDDDLELEECWKAIRPRVKGGRAQRSRLIGEVFGRLQVIAAAGSDKHGSTLWRCLCTCGTVKIIPRGALKTGRVKSCGCLLAEYKKQAKVHLLNRPAPADELMPVDEAEQVDEDDEPEDDV